jgi:hypothetical protein
MRDFESKLGIISRFYICLFTKDKMGLYVTTGGRPYISRDKNQQQMALPIVLIHFWFAYHGQEKDD